jgi:hypothetical protein
MSTEESGLEGVGMRLIIVIDMPRTFVSIVRHQYLEPNRHDVKRN